VFFFFFFFFFTIDRNIEIEMNPNDMMTDVMLPITVTHFLRSFVPLTAISAATFPVITVRVA